MVIIDCELPFEKLNIFSPDPIKSFQIQVKDFETQKQFKALTIMKNMMPF